MRARLARWALDAHSYRSADGQCSGANTTQHAVEGWTLIDARPQSRHPPLGGETYRQPRTMPGSDLDLPKSFGEFSWSEEPWRLREQVNSCCVAG